MVEVVVGTEPVQMALDTGAVVSVASEQLYKRHLTVPLGENKSELEGLPWETAGAKGGDMGPRPV